MLSIKELKEAAELDKAKMDAKSNPKNSPVPEALTGNPWVILEAKGRSGCMSHTGRKMAVPLTGDREAREIQFHEMLHVKFSAPNIPVLPDVKRTTLLCVEDAKIQALAAEVIYRTQAYLGEKFGELSRAYKKGDVSRADLARYVIAGLFTEDRGTVTARSRYSRRRRPSNPGEKALAKMVKGCPEVGDAVIAAKSVKELVETWATMKRRRRTVGEEAQPWTTGETALIETIQSMLDPLEVEAEPDPKLLPGDKKPGGKGKGDSQTPGGPEGKHSGEMPGQVKGEARWAPLPMSRSKLTKQIKKALRDEEWTPQHAGVDPMFINRWAGDRKIFSRRRPSPTLPVILLDVSGSMPLPPLSEFLDRFPRATIACYGGPGLGGAVRQSTVLHILAENGKRVADADLPRTAGNNLSDGLALRWLARQPGKRFWISDGAVTGLDVKSGAVIRTQELERDAEGVCKAANIKRFLKLDTALEYFEKNAR